MELSKLLRNSKYISIYLMTSLGVIFLLAGCSTFGGLFRLESRLQVASEPEGAEVVVLGRNAVPVAVGRTPLSLSRDQVADLFVDPIQITVKKEGFHPESVLIPQTHVAANAQLHVKLREFIKVQDTAMNELARTVAEIQNSIHSRNYDRAEQIAKKATETFGHLSITWDLLGNVYYLRKSYSRALDSYQRSAGLDPNNSETSRMVERLVKLTSGDETRAPAGGGQ